MLTSVHTEGLPPAEGVVILERLVLTFKPEGIEARALYRSEAKAGPNPGTKARAREVRALTRTGLERALMALDGSARVDLLGTSGFTQREDVLGLPAASSDTSKIVREG